MTASLFERVTAALFGGGAPTADEAAERQLVDDTVEVVVETVDPRIRMEGKR